jgi:hypothetical protein
MSPGTATPIKNATSAALFAAGVALAQSEISRSAENQFTGTKPKSRYGRMNRRRHRGGQALWGGQALYLTGLLRGAAARISAKFVLSKFRNSKK